MPNRPAPNCRIAGCPDKATRGGRCDHHIAEARRAIDQRTGNSTTRGYGTAWEHTRRGYLNANPTCVLCGKQATIADHYPASRRALEAVGDPNPDAWHHLRPLCHHCHAIETARHQPGGWAAAPRD